MRRPVARTIASNVPDPEGIATDATREVLFRNKSSTILLGAGLQPRLFPNVKA